jgi:hypothetical protein
VLCAVPTDVECATSYYAVRAHARAGIVVTDDLTPPIRGELGQVTCKLRLSRPNTTTEVFALSCRHVFGRSELFHPDVPTGLRVAMTGDVAIATTTGLFGELHDVDNAPSLGASFDAQLASIDDMAALDRLLAGARIRGSASGIDDIPDDYVIHTPRGKVSAAKIGPRFDTPPLKYPTPRGDIEVVHGLVVESHADVESGDSGSPVVSAGGMLLGMHIAGNEDESIGYMIPAWELFNPHNWGLSAKNRMMLA